MSEMGDVGDTRDMGDAIPRMDPTSSDRVVAGPVAEADRLVAMDVVRGVALLGILVVNMNFFGGPFGRAIFDPLLSEAGLFERAVWWTENTFFTGKFVSLFSLLFGAGLALQMARLDRSRAAARERGARGRSTVATILRRLAVLAGFGLCHALFIWYGDILFFYASIAWLLIPLRHLSTRGLTIAAVLLLFLSACCAGGMGALQVLGTRMAQERSGWNQEADEDEDEEEADVEMLEVDPSEPAMADAVGQPSAGVAEAAIGEAAADSLADKAESARPMERRERLLDLIRAGKVDPSDEDMQALEAEIYREGGFLDALALRSFQWVFVVPVLVILYGPHTLGCMLLGMVFMRIGFFARDSIRLQSLAAMIALPLGFLFAGGGSTFIASADFDPTSWAFLPGAPLGDAGATLLAIGYAGALSMLTTMRWGRSAILPCVASAGRMAFTIYLAESVLMTGLMYWWGLGYFGHFSRIEHIGIAFVTWIALVAMSTWWLRIFRMGPMEWIWRMGTYLEVPRLRR